VGDTIVRIERLANGFTVCARDPEIVKKNKASKGAYNDPNVEYAFKDIGGALRWIKDHIDELVPEDDEYATSFDAATKAAD
jgi:hypothetical protein